MLTQCTFCFLLLFVASIEAKCVGNACKSPCTCTAGDGGTDTECTDASLTAVPCNINPTANGVYLSNNSISDIWPGDLSGLTQLQYLFADHNQLHQLKCGAFSELSELGELFLPDNYISVVELGALPPNLVYLELNNNYLNKVPPLTGVAKKTFTTISLTNNSIGPILNGSAFDAVRGESSALYDINLGGNRIETVEVNTFDKLPALKLYSGRLCLERNPLNCCGLEWLRAVDALDELCPGRAICAAPLHVQGVALKDTKGKICL